MHTIAVFFVGIFAFLSGLFGHGSTVMEVQQTSSSQTSRLENASTSIRESVSEWHTYRNDKYGFEINYPDPLILTGSEETVAFGVCSQEGDTCKEALSVSVKNNKSLEEWYSLAVRGGYYNSPSASRFKDVTVNGLLAREILDPRDSFYRGGSSCYVTAIYEKGRIFELCDHMNNKVTKSIIDSLVIH